MESEIKILILYVITTVRAFHSYNPLISNEAKFVMYGNVTSFGDLLSKPLNYSDEFDDENVIIDEDSDNAQRMWFEKELRTLNLLDDVGKSNVSLPDLKDYSDITKTVNFRRVWHYTKKAGWGGWFLSWLGIFGNMGVWDNSDSKDIEEQKLDMMENCGLQFLIHARFKIQAAMKQKSRIRTDKRYMLGYLFNRMRRVLYDSRKVVYIAMMTNKYKMRRKLRALLRLYQQVARYDVDLVDLARFIRRVFYKPADFDRYGETNFTKANNSADSNFTQTTPRQP